MKRILSMLLALALIISLVPAVFAADEAETITYNIGTKFVSTASFTEKHLIPMATEGADAGKISFTAKSGAVLLDNTFLNVIKNLNSSWSAIDSNHTSFANAELGLVSYRTLGYYMFKEYKTTYFNAYPIRKQASQLTPIVSDKASGFYSEDGTTATEFVMPPSIGDNTAPYELVGRSTGAGHAFLDSTYFYGSWYIGTPADPDANLTNAAYNTAKEQNFAVRIKVPENATAGNYQVKISSPTVAGKTLYGDQYSSDSEVYFTKIDPDTGLEALYTSTNGYIENFVDNSGNVVSRDAYAGAANKLSGTYSSATGTEKTFEEVFNLSPGEEYLVYFRVSTENIDTDNIKTDSSENVYYYSNRLYQNFRLAKIELIPVEVPPALASAEIAYDEETMTASVTGAKMNDGTDATGYTVTYGIDSANGATISSTGVVTPGTDDETVSVYADVTLDGTTVRATISDIKLLGKEPNQLKYRISTDFLNDAALETIMTLAAPTDVISNAETTFISWKDMYYTNNNSTLARATATTTTLAPITNILSSDTDKYEFPGRAPADLVPKLLSEGFISQFLAKRYDADGNEIENVYKARGLTGRPHYAIKLYIPQKGAYALSLGNNFATKDGYDYGSSSYFTKSDSTYTSLGRESMTEVYFAKADYDLNYSKGQGNLSATGAEAYIVDDNKIGWYDSGRYGETQTYDGKYLVAPEAGEYFLIFTVTDDSLTENPNVYHRKYTDANTGAVTSYQDYQLFMLSEIELTPVDEDSEYKESFDAVVDDDYTTGGTGTVAAYTYTDKEEAIELTDNTVTLGETVEVTAPDKEGYSFLYWAKGLGDKKQVISYNERLTYKPAEGANYVIAVYVQEGEEDTCAEFYNANGSLIATVDADGKAPAYPSMAGYGVASGWQLYGTEEVYGYDEEIADMAGSGKKILVAKYDEKPGKVKVNGVEYTYGETVEMPTLDSSKIFKGWKRDGEIVSVDPDYTFKAWEETTVEADYADSIPVFSGKFMKIIIDAFEAGNDTAVMAEFIGIENAVEKGIMVGNKKVAMKGNGNQFSLLADVPNTTYIGYAILRDGTTFIEVTDGSYTSPAAAE